MTNQNPNDNPHAAMARKNAQLGLGILTVVICMVGLAYASVPLYNLFCRVTGFGGTPQLSDQFPDQIIDRDITVNFDADTAPNLPWDFAPEQRTVTVKIGQKGLMAFHAKNKSDKPVAGSAIYNVTPLKAGKYFHKVQCFCFDEQILKPNETMTMPVMFYIDPKMHEDRNMDDVQTITLSYTFFKSESEELEQALEDFYNQ